MAERDTEKGHLIVGVMAFVAIMLILGTVATQAWVEVVRRDNEAEMMFRAQEIVRAIARFQKDQGRPPLSLDELIEPGQKGQYFIRRLYDDPLVEDGKWGILRAAPGGGIFDPSNPDATALPIPGGNQQQGLGNASNSTAAGSQFGQRRESPGGAGANQQRNSSSFGSGQTGQAGEGLPIVGVRTLSDDTPFRVYRGSQNYAQWLFTIYDLQQQGQQQGQGQQQQQGPGGGG